MAVQEERTAFIFMLDDLVKFARKNYPEFEYVSEPVLQHWFEVYKDTLIVDRDQNGEITGFGLYQIWPDFLIFLIICGKQGMNNIDWLLEHCHEKFAGQTIAWFDEEKMEARFHKCR